jgi:16S rRNA (guanine527-N7)-methyltransferase
VLMETARIGELLRPFLGQYELSAPQSSSISLYVDILLRWNERTNLTAIRDPEQIVRRHFGESLFAATQLLSPASTQTVIDVGSGAGFPGLPMKIFAPEIDLTLLEAHSKKNTFLREVVRSLDLQRVEAYLGRAEEFPGKAELVTMRAVEKFDQVLPVANNLVAAGGRMALMIGARQQAAAMAALPGGWAESIRVPEAEDRILLVRQIPQ